MPQVICTLPNAAHVIGGYTFSDHAKGKISEELPFDVASRLAAIEGYQLVDIESAQKQAQDVQEPITEPAIQAEVVENTLAKPAKK